MTKLYSALLLACILSFGCSQSITEPGVEPISSSKGSAFSTNQWIWGQYTVIISADRTQVDVVPLRESSWHINVTKFVEGPPCPRCLTIGKPHPHPGGTLYLKVQLQHPFYGHQEWTGFDVRGIVIFKATDYMLVGDNVGEVSWGSGLMDPLQLNFSDPLKGGAALINADGYTFYLNPLIEYPDKPWLNYTSGKRANDAEIDCTVNPYKLFADASPRHMFKSTDLISRTYHLKLPDGDGPFEFGYVISACWMAPDVMPVTNPETDFRVEANAEDPYEISAVQLQPINYGVGNEPLFKVFVKHRKGEWPRCAYMLVPDLSSDPDYVGDDGIMDRSLRWQGILDAPEDVNYIDDETSEFVMRITSEGWMDINNALVPGMHLGIIVIWGCGEDIKYTDGYESQLYAPIGVLPVYVNVEL